MVAGAPPIVIVMGVSGSGKTTLGTRLATRTGWPFLDADSLHPAANVAKMRAGIPLTDADRWPWLRRMADWITERRTVGEAGIVGCSALKRSYRDVLRSAAVDLRLVYLDGQRDELVARLAHRANHFFPVALLDTQLTDLEPPGEDENPITIPIGQSTEDEIDKILLALGR